MTVVEAVVERGRIRVAVPWAAKDLFKSIPGATWDETSKRDKRWHWPASTHTVEALGRTAKACGLELRGDTAYADLRAQAINVYRARDALRAVDLPDTPGATTAWLHQRQAHHFVKPMSGAILGMWMGTGKTRTAIGLLEEWEAMRVLIVCPSTVVGVWPDQITQHAVRPWLVSDGGYVGLGSVRRWGGVADRTEHFRFQMDCATLERRPFACVLNIESCWRNPFYKWARSTEWDVVILDESHRAKAPGGRQSMAMHTIGKHAARRLALTGTPMPHSPLDVYAQARFVDEGVLGTSYAAFKKRYCDESIYDHSVTFKNLDQLASRLASVMFQCGKEVLDLPPIIEEATHPGTDRSVVLSPRTSRAYQQMWTEMVADVGSGVVVAQNALSRVLRLQQMTSGYVGGVGDDEHIEQLGTEKRDAFADWLTDTRTSYDEEDDPVVVFARFRPDLDAIAEVAAKQDLRYGEVSGRTKDGLTAERRLAPGVQVLGVQMQSGGVGIDLTAARFAVYYSIGHSLGDYLQSRDRVHRPGQARTTTYVHLVAKGTVDVAIRQALADKRDIIEAVLSAARREDLKCE